MSVTLIGLGLGDEKDITVRGLEAIKACDALFLESYTSVIGVPKEQLEAYYEKEIRISDREDVEMRADEMLEMAEQGKKVGFLVVGDPLCATTHTDLILRGKERGIEMNVIHNVSVMVGMAQSGLQLYSFGQSITIPFFTDEWKPDSFYNKIAENQRIGLHTLCLLDIKVKEPDYSALTSHATHTMALGHGGDSEEEDEEEEDEGVGLPSMGLPSMGFRVRYLPPRFMTVNQAIAQLLEVESMRNEGLLSAENTIAVGMARLGQHDQCIKSGTLGELLNEDFGGPLHCMIIPGKELHPLEFEMMKFLSVNPEHFAEVYERQQNEEHKN
jgi:diphthine synthase